MTSGRCCSRAPSATRRRTSGHCPSTWTSWTFHSTKLSSPDPQVSHTPTLNYNIYQVIFSLSSQLLLPDFKFLVPDYDIKTPDLAMGMWTVWSRVTVTCFVYSSVQVLMHIWRLLVVCHVAFMGWDLIIFAHCDSDFALHFFGRKIQKYFFFVLLYYYYCLTL